MQFGQVWDDKAPDTAPIRVEEALAEIQRHDADIITLQEVEKAGPNGQQIQPPPHYTRVQQTLPGYDSYFLILMRMSVSCHLVLDWLSSVGHLCGIRFGNPFLLRRLNLIFSVRLKRLRIDCSSARRPRSTVGIFQFSPRTSSPFLCLSPAARNTEDSARKSVNIFVGLSCRPC